MRRIVLVWTVWAGCSEAPRDCCDLGEEVAWLDIEACAEGGGAIVSPDVCAGVDDADLPGDSDDAFPEDAAGRCARFCEALIGLCPAEVDACDHSCETSTTSPGPADVECVLDAPDCPTAERACWAWGDWG